MPGPSFTQPLLALVAASLFLACCASVDRGGTGPDLNTAASTVRLELIDATATLDRIVDPGEDPFSEDVFILTTVCSLRLENLAPEALEVWSYFFSPFDDFRLRIFNRTGDLLGVSSHVFTQEPRGEAMAFLIPEGTSFVRLVCTTPVSPKPIGGDLPFIPAPALTEQIQLQYIGGFPGSTLRGTVESNRLSLPIQDRTADPQSPETPPPAGVSPQSRLPFQPAVPART
ncbi:MAG TPA: hypothetical protein VMN36_05015 [Verrucomicrobiales bacterium]|nr:hypothetical protein [Verrucomicrobiales bacterium]